MGQLPYQYFYHSIILQVGFTFKSRSYSQQSSRQILIKYTEEMFTYMKQASLLIDVSITPAFSQVVFTFKRRTYSQQRSFPVAFFLDSLDRNNALFSFFEKIFFSFSVKQLLINGPFLASFSFIFIFSFQLTVYKCSL